MSTPMSTQPIESHTVPTTASDGARILWARAFARYIYLQRRALGLTLAQAAELSGMQACAWIAMEEGSFVPEDLNVIRSIEGTLEVSRGWLDTIGLIARFQQSYAA
jgi:transcriptional regulator with XRE-family HTH domain